MASGRRSSIIVDLLGGTCSFERKPDRHRALADGGGDAFGRAGADVADREDAGPARLQQRALGSPGADESLGAGSPTAAASSALPGLRSSRPCTITTRGILRRHAELGQPGPRRTGRPGGPASGTEAGSGPRSPGPAGCPGSTSSRRSAGRPRARSGSSGAAGRRAGPGRRTWDRGPPAPGAGAGTASTSPASRATAEYQAPSPVSRLSSPRNRPGPWTAMTRSSGVPCPSTEAAFPARTTKKSQFPVAAAKSRSSPRARRSGTGAGAPTRTPGSGIPRSRLASAASPGGPGSGADRSESACPPSSRATH